MLLARQSTDCWHQGLMSPIIAVMRERIESENTFNFWVSLKREIWPRCNHFNHDNFLNKILSPNCTGLGYKNSPDSFDISVLRVSMTTKESERRFSQFCIASSVDYLGCSFSPGWTIFSSRQNSRQLRSQKCWTTFSASSVGNIVVCLMMIQSPAFWLPMPLWSQHQ